MKKVFLFAGICLPTLFGTSTAAQEVDSTKVYQLNEVIVSAIQARKETPVAFQNLSAGYLEASNTGQSLPYLFAGTPSLTFTSDGGNGVGYATMRIRGTDADRINFTVDGVPLNEAESQQVFWVNMPDFASSVNSVQIQRGVGTSTNGSAAFGATVSMLTQKPALQPYAEVSSSAGSFATLLHTVKGGTGLLWNHFVFDARYSNVQTNGYIDRARADMNSYYASGAYYKGGTMLKFQTFGSAAISYQAWNGVDASMLQTNRRYNSCGAYVEDGITKFYDNQTDNYWQHHYHLLGTHRLNERLDVNMTLHYTDGKGYYEDYKANVKYAAYKLPDFVDCEGLTQKRTDLVRRKWMRNDFYGGLFRSKYETGQLQVIAGASVNNYIGDHFGRVMWVKSAADLPKPDYEYYRNRGEKLDYNVYLKSSFRLRRRLLDPATQCLHCGLDQQSHSNSLLESLSAYIDLQYRGIDYRINGSDDKAGDNLHVDRHFSFFNPKAGISYDRNGHNAYISYAIAHREPNRKNFTESGSAEQPTFETLYDLEAGYSFATDRFQAGINLYYMNYRDQLILTGKLSEIGEPLTSNIKDSYRAGVELSGAFRIASFLRWEGNVTFSRNKIRDFIEYVDTYDADWNALPQTQNVRGTTDIAFSPNLIMNSMFDCKLKNAFASFSTAYVSRQYLDNTSEHLRSLAPYLVSNLRVGYTFFPSLMKELFVDVSINNIFNEQYETNGWVWSYILGGERRQDCGYFTQASAHVMGRLIFKF